MSTHRERLNTTIRLLDDLSRDLKEIRADITQTDEVLRDRCRAVTVAFEEKVQAAGEALEVLDPDGG